MGDPDRPTSHNKTFDRDTLGVILRIIEFLLWARAVSEKDYRAVHLR